jgi:hypothetical protein
MVDRGLRTAVDGLDDPEDASLGGWAVKTIDQGIRGAPLHYPALA